MLQVFKCACILNSISQHSQRWNIYFDNNESSISYSFCNNGDIRTALDTREVIECSNALDPVAVSPEVIGYWTDASYLIHFESMFNIQYTNMRIISQHMTARPTWTKLAHSAVQDWSLIFESFIPMSNNDVLL